MTSGTGLFFAVAEVTSFAYKAEDDAITKWPWRVNVRIIAAREFFHDGVPLETLKVDGRDLRKVIKRRSHLHLSEAEYDAAAGAFA